MSVHTEACLLTAAGRVGTILLSGMKKNYSSGSRTSFWRKIAARNWRRRAQKLFIYPLIFDFDRFCLYFRSIGRRNVCCSCFNFGYTLGVFRRCNFVFVSQRRYYFGSGHPHLLPHSLSFMMGALEYYISSHLCYGDGKVHHESAERVLGIRLYHLFFSILLAFAKEETRQKGIKSANCCLFVMCIPFLFSISLNTS
jgi:hypothetical protein